MEEFPLPWTIENLGPVNYAKVAKDGLFFDPFIETLYRPALDPLLAPDSPILKERETSERVQLAHKVYAAVVASPRARQNLAFKRKG
jgi:hypothetical protein